MEINEITKFVWNNWYLFVALGVVLGLLALDPLRRLLYRLTYHEPAELVTLINRQNAVVVDVRDPGEYRTGHIVGSLNLPAADLPVRAAELDKYKTRPIVFAGRIGQGAVKGAILLRKRGFEQVGVLAGGIGAWERAQLPVEK
jgi:rhodanese-related sulfurtransferase